MRKPDIDESDVRMSDVLCDFCQRPWTQDVAMIEGHHGSCLCTNCLTVAYTEVVRHGRDTAPPQYTCPMCLEAGSDRESMGRGEEGGWQSPLRPEAVICRRCIDLAAKALDKDKDFDWTTPAGA